MKISFSPPYINDDVRAEVMACLDSGWITTGPRVRQLESLISEMTGVTHTVCCNSATSALMLMLHWFGIGKGDEVIIPSYTYAATALVVLHVGATPVMVDAASDMNIDVAAIAEKVTAKTKAIIPVDFAGWPCDYRAMLNLVSSKEIVSKFTPRGKTQEMLGRILVLGDSAHALGSVYANKPVGQWADVTVFSLHAVKNVTTAEGGAIGLNLPASFNNEEVHRTLKLWTLNGQTKDAFSKSLAGDWKYDIVYPGFKMNMPDICAAIGVAQIRQYKSFILPERKKIDQAYRDGFGQQAWVQLPPEDTSDTLSSYHLFALRIRGISEDQRNQIIQHIAKKEVSVNVHFQPLPILTVFRDLGYRMSDYPVAFDNYSREISLPVYPGLDQDMTNFIIAAVIEAYTTVTNG